MLLRLEISPLTKPSYLPTLRQNAAHARCYQIASGNVRIGRRHKRRLPPRHDERLNGTIPISYGKGLARHVHLGKESD